MREICFFIIVCLFSVHPLHAQYTKEGPVPEKVIEKFNEKYPDTYVYEWEWKKKEELFEAEFFLKGIKYEAYFSSEGLWVLSKREIKIDQVPEAVVESLSKSGYENWKVDHIEEQRTPTHDLCYKLEVKMKSPKRKVHLYYLADGKMLEVIED